jgi:dTDP-4-dehydrorhamnose 3,5-epimerase
MRILPTALESVILLEPKVHGDSRGFFMESFNQKVFTENGLPVAYVQDNHSYSAEAGTLRGLHYQLSPKAQTKLVRVTAGAIYDVALDIRRDSPSFGHWTGVILSASNKRMLLVPQGYAHGFCTLVPHTEVLYKVDELYDPELDRGIAWNDPFLGIDWPVADPVLSEKDRDLPLLEDAELERREGR